MPEGHAHVSRPSARAQGRAMKSWSSVHVGLWDSRRQCKKSWKPFFAFAIALFMGIAGSGVLASPPQRVVSLLPSMTETVCAIGACDRLVGVDRYSAFPASVRSLPRLGGGLDPNIEAIVALRPDLVLIASSSRAAERLEALGLRVVAMEPKTYDEVRIAYQRLGAVLGIPGASHAWQQLNEDMESLGRALPTASRGAKVYFEVGDGPYAAGDSSFIGETLRRLGAKNIVPASLGPFPRLNPEFVVRADPEVIFIVERSAAELRTRPGWQRIRALRDGRVCTFSPEESDALVRPGPRMLEAARIMLRCLNASATNTVGPQP